MKILVIDDSLRLAERIKDQLGEIFIVDLALCGKDAIAAISQNEYSVIILDLGLPDMDGLEVCKKIRSIEISTPIIVLTAEDSMSTRIDLLNSGADDYMTKPFNHGELRARIAALARRQPPRYIKSLVTFGDLVVDIERREVFRNEILIKLRRKEFDILEYLISNPGKVLTRAMIIQNAWDQSRLSHANTVDVHIKHLRDKIDRPFETPLISTVYGIGYRFNDSK